MSQLPLLNRILTLKDLGFTLEQITQLVQDGFSSERLKDLLLLKHAELEAHIQQEKDRLERVEVRLRTIEQEGIMPEYDVTLKSLPSELVASVRDRALEQHLPEGGRSIQRHYDILREHLENHGLELAEGQLNLWRYDEGNDEPEAEVAQPIERPIPETDRVRVYELPAVPLTASLEYRGRYDGAEMTQVFTKLHGWVEQNGYRSVGPTRQVFDAYLGDQRFAIELEVPIAPC